MHNITYDANGNMTSDLNKGIASITYNALNLPDQLGNNRMVLSESAAVEQVTHYYPYGLPFASSTSRDLQRFKYNGKELDTENNLNWMDYGARMYDAALGRWNGVDALAEKNSSQSPYGYCVGNPVVFVDPCGTDTFRIFDDKAVQYSSGGKNDVFMIDEKQICCIKANSTTLQHVSIANKPDRIGYDILIIDERSDAEKLFKAIANISKNEWSLIETGEYGNGFVSTSYNNTEERAGGHVLKSIKNIWRYIHSHPYIDEGSDVPSEADINFIKKTRLQNFKPCSWLYRVKQRDFVHYNSTTDRRKYFDMKDSKNPKVKQYKGKRLF